MPPLHPIIIHFPIALYIVATVFEGIILFTGSNTLNDATRLLMAFSFIGVVAALITGDLLKIERGSLLPGKLLTLHILLALLFAGWMVFLLILRFRPAWKPTKLYFTLAMLGVVILIAVGDSGGEMVWPKLSSPEAFAAPVSHSTPKSQSTSQPVFQNDSPAVASEGNGSQTSSSKEHHSSETSNQITSPKTAPTGQHLPAAKAVRQALFLEGADYFVKDCQSCHSLAEPKQYIGALDQSQWRQVIQVMQAYSQGAISDTQANAIAYYLSNLSPGQN